MIRAIFLFVFATAITFALAPRAIAQEATCNVPLSVSPDYGGVKLGMSLAEMRRMFPGSDELRDAPDGEAAFTVSLGMLELTIRREEFKGVRELALGFIGGRLHKIGLSFGEQQQWEDVDAFSQHISKKLALPKEWSASPKFGVSRSLSLECRGFLVLARTEKDGGYFLGLMNTEADLKDAHTPKPKP